jgi:hypothetical protein
MSDIFDLFETACEAAIGASRTDDDDDLFSDDLVVLDEDEDKDEK